ncbi:MAG TPA: amidohydrolase family protein [Pseudonocardia sp.]|nr:amidohydrolase family protein [Pseudonocardia sp.]
MSVTDLPGAQLDRPMFLRQLSTDEYSPLPYTKRDGRTISRVQDTLREQAWRRNTPVRLLADSKSATAAGLDALNREWGDVYYQIPPDALADEDAAVDAFSGFDRVIDVQTHFMASGAYPSFPAEMLIQLYRDIMPDWWQDLEGEKPKWDIAQWLTDIFIRSENTMGVLTSSPGLTDLRNLFNPEMAATRALIERFGGSGRLLTHAVVHANVASDTDQMQQWADELHPNGWKVYTMGQLTMNGWTEPWMLDDDRFGTPFLEKVRAIGPKVVCTHKGISQMVDNGSPRDLGPAAARFPDIQFLVYHSGYEFFTESPAEGEYNEQTANQGVNRLISSVLGAGIESGGNVSAELGTSWFALTRRPEDAAHVLGKLVKYLGEDNVIWGSDSIWYGAPQPILDAFRCFQIPDAMCDRYGYAKLTDEVKHKILYKNACRAYGVDMDDVVARTANDEVTWARDALAEIEKNGADFLRGGR